MKIQPSTNVRNEAAAGAKPERGTAPASPTAAPAEVATVRLSELSARLHPDNAATVPFDRAKVEALKQAIATGRFDVDAALVADRLLASASALSTAK